MQHIKKPLLIMVLIIFSLQCLAQNVNYTQLYSKWQQAELRSKTLFNIALHLQSQSEFYSKQSTIKDSLIFNLQSIDNQQRQIINLKTQQISNLDIINKNLQKEINLINRGLNKEWYFIIGLAIGVIPPTLAIILLGGR